MEPTRNTSSVLQLLYRFTVRVALFAALWWAFSDAYAGSWSFGIPFSMLAAATSLALSGDMRVSISPIGFIKYTLFFFWSTAQSGATVAALALRPSVPVDPDYFRYPFRVDNETARVLIADSATLLPGTLSAGIEGDELVLHAIVANDAAVADVVGLEERVAAMFKLPLVDAGREVTFGG